METSGPADQVMKVMPALTVTDQELDEGLGVVEESMHAVLQEWAA